MKTIGRFSISVAALLVLFLTVSSANAMTDNGQMNGNYMMLTITPFPVDLSKSDNVTLQFSPNPNQKELFGSTITPSLIDHLDYLVIISKDGNEVFHNQMHTHNGVLTLEFSPGSAPVSVTGGESNSAHTETGPFYVSGPVFTGNGNYDISASIVGIEFNPVTPSEDKFALNAVPEFGSESPLVLAISVGTIIFFMYRIKVNPQ
jgi:hypothetical protein